VWGERCGHRQTEIEDKEKREKRRELLFLEGRAREMGGCVFLYSRRDKMERRGRGREGEEGTSVCM
jgi:hypothetical protein